ncbi:MAG TPA: hypothetical protein VF077_09720 [Nitrospiraceae bacterium]
MDWEQHYRQLNRMYSTEYPRVAVGGFFSDAWDVIKTPIDQQVSNYQTARDNLNAVNTYIHQQTIKTPEAASLASDWSRWWDTTGNPSHYTLKIPPEVWDEARNRRLKFDLANAVTVKEKEQVMTVAKTGVTSEQSQGLPERRDPVTGTYYVAPPPPPTVFPPWVKPVFVGAVALGLGLSVVPILRKFLLPI